MVDAVPGNNNNWLGNDPHFDRSENSLWFGILFFFVQARYYRMHNRDAGIFLFLPSKKKKIHDLDFFYITLSKFFLL